MFSEPVYTNPKSSGNEQTARDRAMFISAILNHLKEGSPSGFTEAAKSHSQYTDEHIMGTDIRWAVKIYATYLWGWLHDRQETDGNFMGKFRRRVFLG